MNGNGNKQTGLIILFQQINKQMKKYYDLPTENKLGNKYLLTTANNTINKILLNDMNNLGFHLNRYIFILCTLFENHRLL